ncbi:DUF4440 domain-containing protein [Arthrobacter sp. zg-ZUI100]|uniref:Nuclear transport factor 2 family protein n=1 Tax=Arthrobacter jiangjiafuii TaxID=2817475 RepID=A0A975M2H2_9MICC|nr:DUF4440 domain-containing protein [Arthrobacter jiangjiafuii]MBP3036303.1 DUF4440 domain-containing protein [Arthrobacter jiangjiafuii]MBP3043192.1 DUF4440 domain-containing protein [Arthrobacter jiangjiafuii]QWC08743.1 nuclear transport factor 2 family protein [Arthrobacter jiangjiafuii]
MENSADFHEQYLDAWNEAMASGDAGPIEAFLAPDYHGWLGQEAAAAVPFDGASARQGFREAVSGMRGATVHAAFRTVAPRGAGEAVVCYEMTYRTGGDVTGRALLMESWRREADSWLLCRDFTEVNVGAAS